MSWDQDYSVPSLQDLFEKLLPHTSALQLLKEELERNGIKILNMELVTLDDGFHQKVEGMKVTFSDGRVFVPKLAKKYTADGNYGCDIYKYVLESETLEVKHVDNSKYDEQVYIEAVKSFPITIDESPCGNCNACGQGYGCDSKEDDTWDVENDGG